jgi:hypothetical protein
MESSNYYTKRCEYYTDRLAMLTEKKKDHDEELEDYNERSDVCEEEIYQYNITSTYFEGEINEAIENIGKYLKLKYEPSNEAEDYTKIHLHTYYIRITEIYDEELKGKVFIVRSTSKEEAYKAFVRRVSDDMPYAIGPYIDDLFVDIKEMSDIEGVVTIC